MDPKVLSEILEAVMIATFGASWPLNVLKSYHARTTKGKSLAFLVLIEFGYAVGIINKLFVAESYKWYVLFFYVLNFIMVSADLMLYFRNRKLDLAADAAGKKG